MKLKTLLNDSAKTVLAGPIEYSMLTKLEEGIDKAIEQRRLAILLTSEGGAIDIAMTMSERIRLARKAGIEVNIVGMGFVRSAAVRILMSIPIKHRFVSRDCDIMVHPARRTIKGGDMKVSAREREERLLEELGHVRSAIKLENLLIRQMSRESGIELEAFEEKYRLGLRFSARQAVKNNIVSAIIR